MTPGLTHTLAKLSVKIRVFVSFVQDELVNERTAILELVNTDSFLSKHVEAVLFEHQPARTLPAEDSYLSDLETCDVYMGILGYQYGSAGDDGLSPIHREYLKAREIGLPILLANLLSNYPAMYSGEMHYSALLVPFTVAGAIGEVLAERRAEQEQPTNEETDPP